MIQLKLHKFKCWDNLTLEFPVGKIVLITGKSGAGKSSCLKAIEWVMHASTKKIGPHHTPSAKTQVTLETPQFKVTRTKNPNSLVFIHQNITYKDADAQNKINSLFGQYEVWLSSSLVPQISHNFFLTTTNAGRMDLLNQIAFAHDSPTEHIEKINKALVEHQALLKVALDSYNANSSKFNEYNQDLIGKKVESINTLTEQFECLKMETDSLILRESKRTIEYTIKSTKMQELDRLEDDLKNTQGLKLPTVTKLTNMTELDDVLGAGDLDVLKRITDELVMVKTKLKDLSGLPVTSTSETSYTLTDLQISLSAEERYHQNDATLKALNLSHDMNMITKHITQLNTVLAQQDALQFISELDKLGIVKYKKNPQIEINQLCFDELLEERTRLQEQLVNGTPVPCPHCEKYLIIEKGVLVKSAKTAQDARKIDDELLVINKMITLKKAELSDLIAADEKQRKLYETFCQRQAFIIDKLNQFSNIDTTQPLLSSTERSNYYNTIATLKSIKLVELPTVSSNTIKTALKNQTEHQQYQQLLSSIDEKYRHLSVTDLDRFCSELQIYHRVLKEKLDKTGWLEKRILSLSDEINSIQIGSDQTDLININKTNLQILSANIEEAREVLIVNDLHQNLTTQRQGLVELTSKVESLDKLKQTAVQLECKMLSDICNTINVSMEDVSQFLFQHDIRVVLDLFKQKDKKVVSAKPCVNFQICYKAGVYDNFLDLSGGESDRVSIALTIALHRIGCYPILMFDESLKSLDPELKINVVKTIQHYVTSTVLIVDHDGIENIADVIIDLENL